MKTFNKIATGITLTVALGLAVTAFANPDQPGSGMGPGAQGWSQHGMGHGMQHGGGYGPGAMMQGAQGGYGPGAMMQGGQGPQAAFQLMTPEERTAMHEKMRAATTPEERQQIAAANHAEMQKRAQEKGITLPEYRGPQGQFGAGPCLGFTASATATPAQ